MYRKEIYLLILILGTLVIGSIGLAEDYIPPRIGEHLEYEVTVKSMVHGANQTVSIVESGIYQDRPIIKVRSEMVSVGMVKSLTKYKEIEEIVLDSEGLYPWVIRHEIADKNGVEKEEVTFDYQKGLAVRVFSENGGPEERTEISVPGYIQDVLSLQFYLRKNILQGDNQVYLYSGGKIKKISYQVTKVEEQLNLECGKYPKHYRVYNSDKEIAILVADTPERYPLVIQKNGKIGKIEAKLIVIK